MKRDLEPLNFREQADKAPHKVLWLLQWRWLVVVCALATMAYVLVYPTDEVADGPWVADSAVVGH